MEKITIEDIPLYGIYKEKKLIYKGSKEQCEKMTTKYKTKYNNIHLEIILHDKDIHPSEGDDN